MSSTLELRKTWVIFLMDTDPDTGFISQMKPMAYVETEEDAKFIRDCYAKEDDSNPNREYKYTHL